MNALYLILTAAVACACPQKWGSPFFVPAGSIGGIPAVGNLTVGGQTSFEIKECGTAESVAFTLSKEDAEKSLQTGARVWEIEFFTFDNKSRRPMIWELKREATTTYSVEKKMEDLKP